VNGDILIRAEGVRKSFSGKEVLSGIDLAVREKVRFCAV